jgi:hypothetical protein
VALVLLGLTNKANGASRQELAASLRLGNKKVCALRRELWPRSKFSYTADHEHPTCALRNAIDLPHIQADQHIVPLHARQFLSAALRFLISSFRRSARQDSCAGSPRSVTWHSSKRTSLLQMTQGTAVRRSSFMGAESEKKLKVRLYGPWERYASVISCHDLSGYAKEINLPTNQTQPKRLGVNDRKKSAVHAVGSVTAGPGWRLISFRSSAGHSGRGRHRPARGRRAGSC